MKKRRRAALREREKFYHSMKFMPGTYLQRGEAVEMSRGKARLEK